MDIKNVQSFLTICNLQSFTKAAEQLNYAQPTISNQIQQLEKELGFPLFDRVGKKVWITSKGKEFIPLAEDLVNIQQRALFLGSGEGEMRGVFRVGTLESLLFSNLVRILPEYEQLFPSVDLQVKMGNRVDLLEWMGQNQLDIVYMSGDDTISHDLFCCYKRQEKLVFVVGNTHPLAGRTGVGIKELLSYPTIDTERTGYVYSRLMDIAASGGVQLRHSIVVDNTRAICEILSSGTYLGFLPEYAVASDLENGRLALVDTELPPQLFYSQILYYETKWIPPYMQKLIDMIKEIKPER